MVRYAPFLLWCCIISTATPQVLMDYVVAAVNGEAVTRSDLDTELRMAVITKTRATEAWTTAERRAALDTIINRKLVLQEAARLGIVVTERDVRVAKEVADMREKYTSDAAFRRTLQRHALENETLETWVYDQLIHDEFFRRIFFNALNSAEVATLARAYYDANTSEFIVPPTVTFNALSVIIPKDASAAKKRKIADLTQHLSLRLQQGETYEVVREAYQTQLTLRFEVLTLAVDTPLGAIVAALQDSERSAPRLVSDGYQIVERVGSHPARQKTYAEVSEEIIDRIQQEKAELEFAAWLVERKAEESWHILDDALEQEREKK